MNARRLTTSRQIPPSSSPPSDALKAGIPAIDVLAGGVRDLVSPAAQDASRSPAQGSQHREERPDEQVAPGAVQVFARHQRQADAADGEEAPQDLAPCSAWSPAKPIQ